MLSSEKFSLDFMMSVNSNKPLRIQNRTKYFNPDVSKTHVRFSNPNSYQSRQIKIEVYDFDMEIVTPFIDRAEEIKYRYKKVMKEHKMVKRPKDAKSPDCKRCKECALRNACWNINGGGVKISD